VAENGAEAMVDGVIATGGKGHTRVTTGTVARWSDPMVMTG